MMKPVGIISLAMALFGRQLAWEENLYDDTAVQKNPVARGETPWGTVLTTDFWGTDMDDTASHRSWRPGAITFYRFFSMLGLLDARTMHGVSLALYGIVLWQTYSILRRLLRHEQLSLALLALFAFHPSHVEVVRLVCHLMRTTVALLSSHPPEELSTASRRLPSWCAKQTC